MTIVTKIASEPKRDALSGVIGVEEGPLIPMVSARWSGFFSRRSGSGMVVVETRVIKCVPPTYRRPSTSLLRASAAEAELVVSARY
jgi:hypothetical protein